MSPGCKINFRHGEERNSPNDTNMMIDDDLLMDLNVFDLFDHYDLKSYRTRSEAIRGESPSNSVQQGNFVADDPCPFHTSLQIDQIDIALNPFFSSLTHSYHIPSHKPYTYIHTQFLTRMSFSPSFVPPLSRLVSRRSLSSSSSSLLSSRLDVSISRLDRDDLPPPKSDSMNGGSIHRAIRSR
jgi:hypothetical protein